jgi:pimeloyl-ACP methyl ester carboxylesterase
MQDAKVTNSSTAFAQRGSQRVWFRHRDMDYYLSWILGRAVFDAAGTDVCMDAVRNIRDGDAASWHAVWDNLARRTEGEARAAQARQERDLARAGFLRACTYHRASLFIMAPEHSAFKDKADRMRACFHEAAALFDDPIEHFVCSFGDAQLGGYFVRGFRHAHKRPTLIVIGGIETWSEDCFFMVGHIPADRGYNVLAVDLPGQGMTPYDGMRFGPRMDLPMRAVLDAVLKRADVDASRIALFGFSWGGHIVCKAAASDERVSAMVANPAMPDVFRAALAQQSSASRRDPVSRVAFEQIVWRFGLSLRVTPRNIADRFATAYAYLRHGRARVEDMRCPALLLAGEAEAPITLKIAREMKDKLRHPRSELRVFTAAENGAAHCQVDNPRLPADFMLDWLDQCFA